MITDKVPMPEDWDDHEGWDTYYQARTAGTRYPVPWQAIRYLYGSSLEFLTNAQGSGSSKVWFAGVGIDIAPFVYSRAGHRVLATDASERAISFLEHLVPSGVEGLVTDVDAMYRHLKIDGKTNGPGDLRLRMHDFREPLDESDFDLIVNVKAFQALPEPSMARAAQTFFQALRPGGQAIICTMNVQGEGRDLLEASLASAGFFLPHQESVTWYRQQLNESGIPYTMLYDPFVIHWDDRYAGWLGKWKVGRDQNTLRRITAEYTRRREAETPSVEKVLADRRVKAARVVYNTG